MKKAIFYKEWIKTRIYFPVAVLASLAFVIHALLRLERVIKFKGAAHLWEILLSRDTVFIEPLTYLPLFAGLLLAVVQFVPEMQQKRLKLTLHLPYPQNRMLLLMLCAGLSELFVLYALHYGILYAYLQSVLAPELTRRILLTALPWYICGITAYLLTAWICLEPTWKRRFFNLLLASGIVRVFFLSDVPQAYDGFTGLLLLFTACTLLLPLLSVSRFKAGKQD